MQIEDGALAMKSNTGSRIVAIARARAAPHQQHTVQGQMQI